MKFQKIGLFISIIKFSKFFHYHLVQDFQKDILNTLYKAIQQILGYIHLHISYIPRNLNYQSNALNNFFLHYLLKHLNTYCFNYLQKSNFNIYYKQVYLHFFEMYTVGNYQHNYIGLIQGFLGILQIHHFYNI